ncbi:hypothetical protein SLS57_003685 [Botryosphaeria dothidea]
MPSLTKTRTPDSTSKPAIVNGTDVELQAGAVSPLSGHAEELRRDFSVWSLGALLVCLMGTWEALSSVVAQALTNGQYHWVASLAPSRSRLIASWFTGWINIGGQIVLTASAAFAAGLQFQAYITLNDESGSYVPQRWQGMLFYWLVIAYSTVINIFGSRVLPHTNTVSGVAHVVGFVATVVVMGVMGIGQQGGHSADYDAAAHLAEELPNPSRSVPLAMLGSIIINGLMGLVYCIVMLFALGDLSNLLESPTGFPFMQLFLNIMASPAGATVLALFISLIAVAANAAGTTSTSRTAWAFARDNAIPFARYFSHVSPAHAVPVRAVVATALLQALLGFIYLGNTTAFNAILSMAILGMYASYLLPIAFMLCCGRAKGSVFVESPGPFRLGAWGPLVNAAACAWLVVAMVFSTFPGAMPVTAGNMNYASVVLGGWVVGGAVYYVGWARRWYEGPVVEVFG